jgi:hypothetical protein
MIAQQLLSPSYSPTTPAARGFKDFGRPGKLVALASLPMKKPISSAGFRLGEKPMPLFPAPVEQSKSKGTLVSLDS